MTPRRALALRRLVALLLPRAFRERYRGEMEATFAAVVEEARASGGPGAASAALLRELRDVVVAALHLRVRSHRSEPGRGSRETGRAPGPGGGNVGDRARGVRIAVRTLAKRPAFAAVVVATVAVGVGCSTAMFALVERVLLRPLPYPAPDRLVHVYQTNPRLGWQRGPVSFHNFDDWRRRGEVFEHLSAYQVGYRRTLLTGQAPLEIHGTRVTGDLFETFAVPALQGRTLRPEDEGPGREPVVVLSYALWQGVFGGDPDLVGKPVTFAQGSATVVGIMPEDFPPLYRGEEFWMTFPFSADQTERDQNFLSVIGRLRPGVSVARTQSVMEALIRRIEEVHPEGNEGRSAYVETRAHLVTGGVETQLLLLFGAVGLLLVIASANLAGLMLTRGAARGRELAVRAALGAGRGRLLREIVTESVVLAGVGLALALPLARVLLDAVVALAGTSLPRRQEIVLDPWALAFGAGVTLASATLFGLLPALRTTRRSRHEDLRESGGGAGRGASRLQRGLVVAQVALAVVLLTGAGLLGDSLFRLRSTDTGFDGRDVLTFRISPSAGRYESPVELDAFYDAIVDGLAAVPGVTSVGATWALPFGTSFGSSTYMIEAHPDDETYLAQLVPIRGDYFRTLEISVVRGRSFRPEDDDASRRTVMVSRSLAERAWPGEDPVGKRLRRGSGDDATYMEVVGVVPDVTLMDLGEEPLMEIFLPHAAVPWARELYFAVRVESDPLAVVSGARDVVTRVDDRVPLTEVSTMDGRLAGQLTGPRLRTALVGAFASVAALLSLLGLYGVIAFVVAGRTREIGVRMALGEGRGRILAGVMGDGAVLGGIGVALGLVAAVAASRTVESLLFRTEPLEPGIYAAVVAGVMAAVAVATWVPAHRASAVDPVQALRGE